MVTREQILKLRTVLAALRAYIWCRDLVYIIRAYVMGGTILVNGKLHDGSLILDYSKP